MPPDCRKTHLKFKVFRGSMPPDPPSMACLWHATCLRHVSPKFRPPTYKYLPTLLWYSILSLSGGSCSWELNSRICRQRKSPSACQVWHTQQDNGLITASGLMGLRRTECTQYTLIVYHHWGEVSDGFRSEKLPWWRISITQEQVTEYHHWWLEQEVFLHMLIGNRKHIDYFQWRFSIHFMSDGKPSTSPTVDSIFKCTC